MNRDGYPWGWVRDRALYAMAPVTSKRKPAPGQPIKPRERVTRYGPRKGTETGVLGPRHRATGG